VGQPDDARAKTNMTLADVIGYADAVNLQPGDAQLRYVQRL
jgi:uncharacterized protein YciW